MLLSLTESMDVSTGLEVWDNIVTDDIIDKAVSFDIDWNESEQKTEVSLFDDQDGKLCSVTFNDPFIALGIVEELFDIDEEEMGEYYEFNWIPEGAVHTIDTELGQSFDGDSE